MRLKLWLVCGMMLGGMSVPCWAKENKPDPVLTPGDVLTTDLSVVCQKGYSKTVRKTTREMKQEAYRLYGVRDHAYFKIDHLVPLAIGGADTMKNIWPSDFRAGKYNADAKDRLEYRMLHEVCSRHVDIRAAQAMFMQDWTKGYDLYCTSRAACPSYEERHRDRREMP